MYISPAHTVTHTGWLLQTYPGPEQGMTVWFIDVDGSRRRLQIDLQVTFYASGPFPRLRQLWRELRRQPIPVRLDRVRRRDLFAGEIDLLAVTVDVAQQARLFYAILRRFPELTYYDVDIDPALQLVARHEIFPLGYCRLQIGKDGKIVEIEPLDDRWAVEYEHPPLRILYLQPDCDPFHAPPQHLLVQAERHYQIPLRPLSILFKRVNAVIKRYDPDLIVTAHGDSWLFPLLFHYCSEHQIPHFNPCRDSEKGPLVRDPLSYQTYGQVLYRASQTYLFGRLHIDGKNLTQIYESGLTGIIEQSRITGLPLQAGARRSPGAGFSAMQVITALREGVLVPYRKAQAERPKSAQALLRADQGGLIGQPQLGVHYGALEFDFISMYPAIITRFNISPETVSDRASIKDESIRREEADTVPQLGYRIDHTREGLIPKTLRPLVQKRIALKRLLAHIDRRDCRYATLKQQNNAQKSLQTVAFGYMGHKHFKYTQIEVHESITAYSREAMLLTKELLETAGYEVIHLYVDGIYFKRPEPTSEAEITALLAQIEAVTGLPIGNEGLYKWIIFLPSRADRQASVPNRYFGVFANGEIKIRGIEARTRDTPPFIKEAQMAVIEHMATVPFGERLEGCLPQALEILRRYVDTLRSGRANPESLVITQVLTRDIAAYKGNTRAVRAARQLERAGKTVSKGMRIRYLLTRGQPGVAAWDAQSITRKGSVTPQQIDLPLYLERLIRAGHTVFQSFGVEETVLRDWLLHNVTQLPLPYRDVARHGMRLSTLYQTGV